jgi:hypothetical protein
MDHPAIQAFVAVLREQDRADRKTISQENRQKLRSIMLENNNHGIILYFLDEIDAAIEDVSFWVRFKAYNLLFHRELYDSMKHAQPLEDAGQRDLREFLALFSLGGVKCEVIKIFHCNGAMKQLEASGQTNGAPLAHQAVCSVFVEKKQASLHLLRDVVTDMRTHFAEDADALEDMNYILQQNAEIYEFVMQ